MVTPMRVDGIDISHHQQSKLEYSAAVKAGLKFLYHKATEGASYRDPNYPARRMEAAKAGVPFGAYHFASPTPTLSDATREAEYFLAYARPLPGDLVPALDFEQQNGLSTGQMSTWVGQFVSVVWKKLGVLPLIYTPFNLDYDYGCMLWQPRYNDKNTPPEVVKPWKTWDIWQFSNGNLGVPDTFPGFGHVDLNTLNRGVKVNDFRIPLPEPDPPKRQMAYFKAITQNVQALPLMPQSSVIEDILLTARQGAVIGWQEIGPERYKEAITLLGDLGFDSYMPRLKKDFDSPISWKRSMFTSTAQGYFKFQEGEAKIMMDRYFTWVILQHKASGNLICVTNKHYVSGAWSNKPKPGKDERPAMWRAGRDLELEWLDDFIFQFPAIPIISLGDYNATARIMEKEFPTKVRRRTINYQVGENSIDQIFLISAQGKKWQTEDEDGERLPGRNSDHQGRCSRQRIVSS